MVLVGNPRTSDVPARAIATSLTALGFDTTYIGLQTKASRIAAAVADKRAYSVELCLAGGGGVMLLRELLRELIEVGRRDVSIVVHRID